MSNLFTLPFRKSNPNHDERGRFSSGSGGVSAVVARGRRPRQTKPKSPVQPDLFGSSAPRPRRQRSNNPPSRFKEYRTIRAAVEALERGYIVDELENRVPRNVIRVLRGSDKYGGKYMSGDRFLRGSNEPIAWFYKP